MKNYFLLFFLLACISCHKEDSTTQNASSQSSPRQCKDDLEISQVPNIKLQDLNGKEVSIGEFSGKVVLLNFWATWCAPCVAEMPSLERLYQTYNHRNFEIVAISVDPSESDEEVKKFVKDKGLSFTILRDPEMQTPTEFSVSGFPETYFVGKDGKLLLFEDPSQDCLAKRTIADRPWDSQNYILAVGKLLQ